MKCSNCGKKIKGLQIKRCTSRKFQAKNLGHTLMNMVTRSDRCWCGCKLKKMRKRLPSCRKCFNAIQFL